MDPTVSIRTLIHTTKERNIMITTIKKDFFNFKEAANRLPYLWWSLGLLVAQSIMFGLVTLIVANTEVVGLFALAVPPFVALTVAGLAVATRRTRDTGLNPWWVLALLIPYVNFAFGLFLLFAPEGTVGKDK